MSKVVSFEKSVSKDLIKSLFEQEVTEYDCYKCKKRVCESCEKNHSFYASWAGRCPRMIAYNWLYGGDEVDIDTHHRLLEGKLWHGGIQALLVEKGYAEFIEKKIRYKRNGLIVSCKIDAAINIEGKRVILELKTVNAERIRSTPYQSNVFQLYLAMQIFKYKYGELIYIPVYTNVKDTFANLDKWRFYHFERGDKGKQILKHFEDIFGLIRKNKLPKRRVSKECSWCSKRQLCFGEVGNDEFFD